MSTTHAGTTEVEIPVQSDEVKHTRQIVNDMTIQVATVNGSGSQSSNLVLLRSILQMGVPVSGKNLFPSNIEGLPTWFTIRASKHGYVARRKEIDFLVAMNPETAVEDVQTLDSGAAVVYDEKLNLNRLRDDLVYYPVPFDKIVTPICPEAKLRKLVRNMIYDGVLAKLLNIDLSEMEKALRRQFKKKVKAADLNCNAVRAGFEFAEKNLEKKDPFWIEHMETTKGKILVEGNAAAALGAMMGGVTVVTWYPITPSSSLCENLSRYLQRFRIDPENGKATFAVVQAEDELAAIGMAIGAGWAGARAMTATSGPGISLMAEFAGMGYYVEIPVVVFDIQRVGPSTGLPTRTSQGDVLKNAVLSHGDTRHPLLLPATVGECYSMAMQAFDIAEHLQTPVFVLSDLDLGMNYWMSDGFPYPERPLNRGKVLSEGDIGRLGGFERYRDVDGDGIGYRTIPGNRHPLSSYFARGSGHNEKALYSERPDDYKNNLDRLSRKFETARKLVPAPVVQEAESAHFGIIAYGTTHWAMVETLDQLRDEHRLRASYCRVRAYPFHEEIKDFIRRHRRVYVVEQNRDGQLRDLLKLDVNPEDVVKLRSILHYIGLPIDARSVTDEIAAQEAQN